MTDDVQVKFGADTEDASKGITRLRYELESLTDPIHGVRANLGELAEAFVAAFAVDRIAEFVNHMAELGEQIERMSYMTGLSTDEIQQFGYAIAYTGGNADNAGLTLERFERNILQAATGSKMQADAFKALGIAVRDTDGNIRPVQEVLGDLAERFARTNDGATKTYYAMTLMGRSGAELIPVLDQGREGLQRLNEEFETTGARLTPQQVESLSSLKKAITETGTSWRGFKEVLVAEVSPVFTFIAEGIEGDIEILELLGRELKKLGDLIKSSMPGGRLGPHGFINPEAAPSQNYIQQQLNEQLLRKGLIKQTLPTPPSQEGSTDLQIEKEKIDTELQLEKLSLEQKKEIDDEKVNSGKLSKLQELQNLKSYTAQEYQVSLDALNKELALYEKDSAKYQEVLDKKKILTAQYNLAILKLNAEAAQQQQKQWDDVINIITKDFDTMLSGVLQGTQSWQQAMARLFDNLAISFIEAVSKMIVKWLAFEALGVGNNPFGGGGGVLGGIGSIFSAASFLGAFDTGSWNLPATGLALVHQGEMIIPAQQAGQVRSGAASVGGSGSAVYGGDAYNVTINAVDAQSFASLLQSPAGQKAIVGVISQQTRNFNSKLAPAWKS